MTKIQDTADEAGPNPATSKRVTEVGQYGFGLFKRPGSVEVGNII